MYVHGVAGFLAPLPLMAFLPVSERIGVALGPGGGLRLDGAALLASPFTVAVLVATACSEVALAGTLLAMYAARWGRAEEAAAFRRWGRWGVLTALAAAAGIWITLTGASPGHAARLAQLWTLGAAVAPLGALTLWALWRPGRERVAMAGLVLAHAAGLLAYALSHLPYLVEPELTVAATLRSQQRPDAGRADPRLSRRAGDRPAAGGLGVPGGATGGAAAGLRAGWWASPFAGAALARPTGSRPACRPDGSGSRRTGTPRPRSPRRPR